MVFVSLWCVKFKEDVGMLLPHLLGPGHRWLPFWPRWGLCALHDHAEWGELEDASNRLEIFGGVLLKHVARWNWGRTATLNPECAWILSRRGNNSSSSACYRGTPERSLLWRMSTGRKIEGFQNDDYLMNLLGLYTVHIVILYIDIIVVSISIFSSFYRGSDIKFLSHPITESTTYHGTLRSKFGPNQNNELRRWGYPLGVNTSPCVSRPV